MYSKTKNEDSSDRILTGSVSYGSSQGVKEGMFIDEVIDFYFTKKQSPIDINLSIKF